MRKGKSHEQRSDVGRGRYGPLWCPIPVLRDESERMIVKDYGGWMLMSDDRMGWDGMGEGDPALSCPAARAHHPCHPSWMTSCWFVHAQSLPQQQTATATATASSESLLDMTREGIMGRPPPLSPVRCSAAACSTIHPPPLDGLLLLLLLRLHSLFFPSTLAVVTQALGWGNQNIQHSTNSRC